VIVVPPEAAKTISDKLVHALTYGLLAWLIVAARGVSGLVPGRAGVFGLAAGYGAAMEVLQAFLPWRTGDPMDGLMNALGAAVAVWLPQRREQAS
jgi:VanZ family protein